MLELMIFRSVALVPENTEDMWHAYNIISEGDLVSCSTFRYATFVLLQLYDKLEFVIISYQFSVFNIGKCKWNLQLAVLTVIELELLLQ